MTALLLAAGSVYCGVAVVCAIAVAECRPWETP